MLGIYLHLFVFFFNFRNKMLELTPLSEAYGLYASSVSRTGKIKPMIPARQRRPLSQEMEAMENNGAAPPSSSMSSNNAGHIARRLKQAQLIYNRGLQYSPRSLSGVEAFDVEAESKMTMMPLYSPMSSLHAKTRDLTVDAASVSDSVSDSLANTISDGELDTKVHRLDYEPFHEPHHKEKDMLYEYTGLQLSNEEILRLTLLIIAALAFSELLVQLAKAF